MSENNRVDTSGVGFFSLLTILFVGLKLTGYITWSWFWVLSPLIFGWSVIILIVVFFVIINNLVDR